MKKKLPPLHQAIIDDDLSFIKKESKNLSLAFTKDSLGFTAKELALLLGKQEFAKILGFNPLKNVLVQDLEEIHSLSLSAFEEKFNVKHSPTITFKNYAALVDSLRKIPYSFRFNLFGDEMKRKGTLYREELFKEITLPLSVRFIDAVIGYGLFTEKTLYEGEFIGEYAGMVMKLDLSSKLDTTYLLHYPTRFFSLDMYVIDASRVSNLNRFINHSNIPNLRPEFLLDRGLLHIGLFANRPIKPDEQLTINYGKDYWLERLQHRQ